MNNSSTLNTTWWQQTGCFGRPRLKDFKRLQLNGINYARFRLLSVINRNRRMPSEGSNQMLNSIQTKQVNKVKPNVNRPSIPDGVVVSPSSYNRWVAATQTAASLSNKGWNMAVQTCHYVQEFMRFMELQMIFTGNLCWKKVFSFKISAKFDNVFLQTHWIMFNTLPKICV